MTARASLHLGGRHGATRILVAAAAAPQRWAPGALEAGWLTVYHQLIGEGCFPGDRYRTRIVAGPGARTVVTGATATPLRTGAASLTAVSLEVAHGAALIYAPGALIPHAGARHHAVLRATVHPGGALAIAQVIAPGRSGHEAGRFDELRLRSRFRVGRRIALDERVIIRTDDWPQGSPVVVAIAALGDWPPSEAAWWGGHLPDDAFAAAAPLRADGALVRALVPSLGDAAGFVEAMIALMRNAWQMKNCSFPRKAHETSTKER